MEKFTFAEMARQAANRRAESSGEQPVPEKNDNTSPVSETVSSEFASSLSQQPSTDSGYESPLFPNLATEDNPVTNFPVNSGDRETGESSSSGKVETPTRESINPPATTMSQKPEEKKDSGSGDSEHGTDTASQRTKSTDFDPRELLVDKKEQPESERRRSLDPAERERLLAEFAQHLDSHWEETGQWPPAPLYPTSRRRTRRRTCLLWCGLLATLLGLLLLAAWMALVMLTHKTLPGLQDISRLNLTVWQASVPQASTFVSLPLPELDITSSFSQIVHQPSSSPSSSQTVSQPPPPPTLAPSSPSGEASGEPASHTTTMWRQMYVIYVRDQGFPVQGSNGVPTKEDVEVPTKEDVEVPTKEDVEVPTKEDVEVSTKDDVVEDSS